MIEGIRSAPTPTDMAADIAARPAEYGNRWRHRRRSFVDRPAQVGGIGGTGRDQCDAGYAGKQELFHRSPQGERVEPGRSFTKQGPPKQWEMARFPSILV